MRLWSLHPRYLDAKGLVALWREALLAQKVLQGRTRGYTQHPQLARFRASADPVGAIGRYLAAVECEARRRGYAFDAGKIARGSGSGRRMEVTRGQMRFERAHLEAKLAVRAPADAARLKAVTRLAAHPCFRVVNGGVADWERTTL